jgi:lambda family phage minor tail protein L
MTTPSTDLANLNQTSGFIELYTLDASALGGSVYYFTSNVNASGGALVFGGTTYAALPIATTGWDFTSAGTTPKPVLSVSNVNKTLLSAVVSLGDLVGAKVTRIRTYEKYLDAGSSPDSSKFIGPDVYVIEQKTAHNKNTISWQMTSILDRMGMKLPRRQVLKDKGFPGVSRTRLR